MSDDSTHTWQPNTRDRLTALAGAARTSPAPYHELALRDGVVVRLHDSGTLSLHIHCPPTEVHTDVQSARVRVEADQDGAVLRIDDSVGRNVAAWLIDDVIELLEQEAPRGEAGARCLDLWRDLLARPAGRRLSDRALAGLYGELEVLLDVLEAGGTLDHWTGWSHSPQDFRLPGLALEVKTTTSPDYRRIVIHGLRQLADPTDGAALLLVMKRLDLTPEGRSVPELVDRVIASGAPRHVFLERLHEAGYSEAHRDSYVELRFVSEEVAVRYVIAEHPRLTPDLLRDIDLQAIGKVTYELDLNGTEADDLDESPVTLLRRHLGVG